MARTCASHSHRISIFPSRSKLSSPFSAPVLHIDFSLSFPLCCRNMADFVCEFVGAECRCAKQIPGRGTDIIEGGIGRCDLRHRLHGWLANRYLRRTRASTFPSSPHLSLVYIALHACMHACMPFHPPCSPFFLLPMDGFGRPGFGQRIFARSWLVPRGFLHSFGLFATRICSSCRSGCYQAKTRRRNHACHQ